MNADEADRLKARLAEVRATVEAHVPEWRDGAVAGTAPADGTVVDAAVIAPTALEARWETPCPAREDGQHCDCWYDGQACCGCHDPADSTVAPE